MKTLQVGFNGISASSKKNIFLPYFLAIVMVKICWATTESTYRSIRLNSSKHDQAPDEARPLKNLPIAL